MKIEARDLETGKKFSGEAHELDKSSISDFFNTFDVSDQDLQRWVDRLDLSADAKRMLHEIARKTIIAGGLVIKIGRKILESALFLVRKFPMTTAGLVIGALIGSLAGSVPILGFLIGPLVMPLAVAAGLTMGAIEDIKDASLKFAVRNSIDDFNQFKTV